MARAKAALVRRVNVRSLTIDEQAEILRRRDAGSTQVAVAKELGITRQVVQRVEQRWKIASEEARRYLLSRQLELAERAVKNALAKRPRSEAHEVVMDLLERCGTVSPKPTAPSSQTLIVHPGYLSNVREELEDK